MGRGLPIELSTRLTGLSQPGIDWLTAAADPCHDERVVPTGLPDADSRPSVVLRIEKSRSISAPSGTTGNWAFSVAANQWLYSNVCIDGSFVASDGTYAYNANGIIVYESTALCGSVAQSAKAYGPLNFNTYSSDVATLWPDGTGAFTTPAINACLSVMPDDNGQGIRRTATCGTACRVIAAGFELINTTAELYRQGLITVAEVPRWRDQAFVAGYSNPPSHATNFFAFPTQAEYDITDGPCPSIAVAQQYNRTAQFAARDGVYVPIRIDHQENEFQRPVPRYSAFTTSNITNTVTSSSIQPSSSAGTLNFTPNIQTVFTPSNGYVTQPPPPQQYIPCYSTTALATGLSVQSTFTLRSVYYVEISPSPLDPNYAALVLTTKPSPPRDQLALDLYAAIVQKLPVAVPQTWNPAGEWFGAFKKVVMNVLTPAAGIGASLITGNPAYAFGAVNAMNTYNDDAAITQLRRIKSVVPKKKKVPSRASSAGSARSAGSRASTGSTKTKKKVTIKR